MIRGFCAVLLGFTGVHWGLLGFAGALLVMQERRHLVGGAAVTEEIIPGFKFSRASYLAGDVAPPDG